MIFARYYLILLVIFCVSIFFLFFHLDTPLLWEDEGEVAIIARNIIHFGLPVTWDGKHFVTQEIGEDSSLIAGHYLFTWNT
ncbi:hypothetical protein HY008_03620 [Candidatus Woesebacteria bacterium]|nr:hypothetical protein [Candidatus Woesebacteria bacterium]